MFFFKFELVFAVSVLFYEQTVQLEKFFDFSLKLFPVMHYIIYLRCSIHNVTKNSNSVKLGDYIYGI